MARWRLAAPHYLKVEGTTWEYKEVDRQTGKNKRTLFPVPLLLDPDQPSDWNYVYGKDSGEIIVANKESVDHPKDIIFQGEPTPDMVPLDDEAKAISAKLAAKWKHPIETLSGSYADEMMKDLSAQMQEVREKTVAAPMEGMSELLTAMTAMMKQNQELLNAVVASKAPAAAGAAANRRN